MAFEFLLFGRSQFDPCLLFVVSSYTDVEKEREEPGQDRMLIGQEVQLNALAVPNEVRRKDKRT